MLASMGEAAGLEGPSVAHRPAVRLATTRCRPTPGWWLSSWPSTRRPRPGP